jgi:hypothetical protein
MKLLIIILIFAGLVGVAFGAWGIYTPQGRTKFDEMDGLYPFFSGIAGIVSVVIAFALIAFRFWAGSARG